MTESPKTRAARDTGRRVRRRALLGAAGTGAALLLAVSGVAEAAPAVPDGVLGAVGNSSSDLNLPDLLGALPGLLSPGTQPAGTTRCDTVIQVGDSTSVAADTAAMLPSAGDTADAQYRRVGARNVTVDALSGRAIVDGPGPDAKSAIATRLGRGERGCWVIAMGVNDAGAISSGSSVDADARIDAVMRQLAGQPVLWPTIASSNPQNRAFDSAAMAVFNDALRRATARYDDLAVYDWSAAARPEMFTDGLHYTAAATAERNRRFADALARAYPAGAGSTPAVRWIG